MCNVYTDNSLILILNCGDWQTEKQIFTSYSPKTHTANILFLLLLLYLLNLDNNIRTSWDECSYQELKQSRMLKSFANLSLHLIFCYCILLFNLLLHLILSCCISLFNHW